MASFPVLELPVEIEEVELERLEVTFGEWTRATTVVHLRGRGAEGVGEDVTYQPEHHTAPSRRHLTWLQGAALYLGIVRRLIVVGAGAVWRISRTRSAGVSFSQAIDAKSVSRHPPGRCGRPKQQLFVCVPFVSRT